ncbi:MAG: hypothetical protein CMA05_01035 [Euryarchaeota archaeon]|nr:hypothetical protein [Euryarchaeota archaeon]|tara:strand:+ start:574 stop:1092 length:519 start_codon:yes stop_codon:yes gene_type:complete
MEREQGTLTESFSDSVLKQASIQDKTTEEITLHVKPQPVVNDDGSFASLATRIVDEVVATKSPKALAKQVLERVGIGNDGKSAEPQVFNGHLRHVGRRARKVVRKQNDSQQLKIRRVKKANRGPPPNIRRMGAPPETRVRPPIGMEDETRRSARDLDNKRGKSKRKRRLFRR